MLTQGQREVDHHRGSAGERPLRPAGTASLWGRQLHTLDAGLTLDGFDQHDGHRRLEPTNSWI